MTDQRDLSAGPELDRVIAETIGLQWETKPPWTDWNTTGDPMYRAIIGGVPQLWCSRRDKCIPEYSTDLNAAWALFDDLPKGYTPRIVRVLEPRGNHMAHVVKAGIIHRESNDMEAHADTPAFAICLAWLAWKESQENT